jgi:Tfp pilus assembly protein PilF
MASQPKAAGAPSSLLQAALQQYHSGDLTAARTLFQQLLQRDESNLDALLYQGIIAGRLGDYTGARSLLEKVVAHNPLFIDGLNALANVEGLDEHWGRAQEIFERALVLNPHSIPVLCNFGICLRAAGKLDAAESTLRRAFDLAPDVPDVLLNLAMVLIDIGRPGEAQILLRRCLEIDRGLAEAHTGLAHLLLQQGEFAAGWSEYGWRFKCLDTAQPREIAVPQWNGRAIPGAVLLVRAEQGLGDQLMFASCLPDAVERAGLCLVECDPRLVGVFSRSFPRAKVFAHYPKSEPRWQREGLVPDYQVYIGNLPALFRSQAADFPRHQGYVRADDSLVEHWRARLDGLGHGRKIGISWRGGGQRTRKSLRSIALAAWLPILRQEQAVFVSLQYGDCRDEIDALAQSAGLKIQHWQNAIDDYDQTAGLVGALDQIISVQTAVVHLAGALGKPVWALVPAVPEWRYMAEGEVMPWYPSVRLLRQRRHGDWNPVIDSVARLLSAKFDACANQEIS